MEVINNTLEEFENAENYEKEKHKSHKIPLFKKKNNHYYYFGAFSCFSRVFCISAVHMSMITGPFKHWGNKSVTEEEEKREQGKTWFLS